MIEVLQLIVWLIVIWLCGSSVLTLIFRRLSPLFSIEHTALAYPIGLGLISIEMFLCSLMGIKFQLLVITLPWVVVWIAAFFQHMQNTPMPKQETLTVVERCFILGIAIQIVYVFFTALLEPIMAFDAVMNHAIKAKIFFLEGGVPVDFVERFREFLFAVQYPLLLPLAETFFYLFFGGVEDGLVKIIFPLFYVSMLVIFYCGLIRCVTRKKALLFTFLLATVPQFAEYATNGYAEFLISFYFTASALYLLQWGRDQRKGLLLISFILISLALWTKVEGLILFAVNGIVMLTLIFSQKNNKKSGWMYILGLIIGAVGYLLAINMLNINLHDNSTQFVVRDFLGEVFSRIGRLPTILDQYQMQIFGPKKWNLIWVVVAILFFVNIKRVFNKHLLPVTVLVLSLTLGYMMIYFLTIDAYEWVLEKSLSRLMIHHVAIVTFYSALLFKEANLDV